jgi:NIPSNAP
MLRRLNLLTAFSLLIGIALSAQPQQTAPQAKPVYELRIYKLNPANKQHFHDRFRDQCMPIMKRYGFDIVFTSETTSLGGPEFVYLLRWPSDEVRTKAWKAFLADPDWVAIKKTTTAKYGDLVEDVQDRQLQLTPYTPAPSTVP